MGKTIVRIPYRNTSARTYLSNGESDQTSRIQAFLDAGGSIFFPPGEYLTGALTISGIGVEIDMAEGAYFKAKSGFTGTILQVANSGVLITDRIRFDGAGSAHGALAINTDSILSAGRVEIADLGSTSVAATTFVVGVYPNAANNIHIRELICSNFNAVADGTFGNNPGAVRGLMGLSSGPIHIGRFEYSGGNAEEIDPFQLNVGCSTCVIEDFVVRYNGNYRRCAKFQSGNTVILRADIRKGDDFVAVSGSTDVGEKNFNCIDWASGDAGSVDIMSGYIDVSGYATGITISGGGYASMRIHPGVTIIGPTKSIDRTNPQTGLPQTGEPTLFSIGAGSAPGGINGAKIIGGRNIFVIYSNYQHIRNCDLMDPLSNVWEVGKSNGDQIKGIDISGNTIYTTTTGALNNTRLGLFYNVVNTFIDRNRLIQDGNTTHATRFLDFANVNADVVVSNNTTPTTITTLANSFVAGVKIKEFGNNGNSPYSTAQTGTLGNVGGGEDNLRTHTLRSGTLSAAGKGVKITAWGDFANNANAKTVKLYFGTTAVLTGALPTSAAGSWYIESFVVATGTDAQEYVAKLNGLGVTERVETGTSAQDDAANITIKCTGTATTDNDITQRGFLIEVIN